MTNPLVTDSRYFYARDSFDPRVDEIVNNLAKGYAFGRSKKQLKHLKYLLLDLKYRYLETPKGYIHCSRDKNSYVYYKAINPFKSLQVMPDSLITILDKLTYMGLLEYHQGFQTGQGRQRTSFASRYKYTDELLEYLHQIPESAIGYERGIAEEIVLRSKNTIPTETAIQKQNVFIMMSQLMERLSLLLTGLGVSITLMLNIT